MLTNEVYILPEFWAVALFNDDTSHFDDTDHEHFNAFCNDMDKHYRSWWVISVDDEGDDFRKHHDATYYGVLACNVREYTFAVEPYGYAANSK